MKKKPELFLQKLIPEPIFKKLETKSNLTAQDIIKKELNAYPDKSSGPSRLPASGGLSIHQETMMGVESNHGKFMKNSDSGASGYLQWMPDTAARRGVVPGDIDSEIRGFNAQDAANRKILAKRLGRDESSIEDWESRLAWLGVGNAAALLGHPDMNAVDAIAQHTKQSRAIAEKTIRQNVDKKHKAAALTMTAREFTQLHKGLYETERRRVIARRQKMAAASPPPKAPDVGQAAKDFFGTSSKAQMSELLPDAVKPNDKFAHVQGPDIGQAAKDFLARRTTTATRCRTI